MDPALLVLVVILLAAVAFQRWEVRCMDRCHRRRIAIGMASSGKARELLSRGHLYEPYVHPSIKRLMEELN